MKKYLKYIYLQGVIVIYSISSVMSKLASGQKDNLLKFILFFGLEFVFLGIYAILWQQVIKRFDLTIAYANRAMVILWSTIWAIVFFHDKITLQNVVGIILVMIGLVIVNTDEGDVENE